MRKSVSPTEGRNPEASEYRLAVRPCSGMEADLPDWVTRGDLHPSRAVHGSASETACPLASDGCTSQTRYVMLSVAEYARLFRVSTKMVRRMIDRGDLHAVHIGRSIRIPVSIEFVNTLSAEPHCFR